SKDRAVNGCGLCVVVLGQMQELESSYSASIDRITILSESDQAAVHGHDAAGRPGNAAIPSYNRAGRVLDPWPPQLVSHVQTKSVVPVWRRAQEYPPFAAAMKRRWISAGRVYQLAGKRPRIRKGIRFIKSHGAGVQRFGHHQVFALPFEDVR